MFFFILFPINTRSETIVPRLDFFKSHSIIALTFFKSLGPSYACKYIVNTPINILEYSFHVIISNSLRF